MTKKYTRLTHVERIDIYKYLSHEWSFTKIAEKLGRHKSTISREVKSYGPKGYYHLTAECDAVHRSSNRRSGKTKMKQHPELGSFVVDKLGLKWSPDQISCKLRQLYPALCFYPAQSNPGIKNKMRPEAAFVRCISYILKCLLNNVKALKRYNHLITLI